MHLQQPNFTPQELAELLCWHCRHMYKDARSISTSAWKRDTSRSRAGW